MIYETGIQQEWIHDIFGLTVKKINTFIWKVEYTESGCPHIPTWWRFSDPLAISLHSLLHSSLSSYWRQGFQGLPQSSLSCPPAFLPICTKSRPATTIHVYTQLQGHCTITVLVCFCPVIYGVIHIPLTEHCRMLKNWTCLKRFSLFNKWLLFCRRLEESP